MDSLGAWKALTVACRAAVEGQLLLLVAAAPTSGPSFLESSSLVSVGGYTPSTLSRGLRPFQMHLQTSYLIDSPMTTPAFLPFIVLTLPAPLGAVLFLLFCDISVLSLAHLSGFLQTRWSPAASSRVLQQGHGVVIFLLSKPCITFSFCMP